MARVTKINVGGTNYDIAHEGELKNSGFEVVSALPTTGLFEGRQVFYQNRVWTYSNGWVSPNNPVSLPTEVTLESSTEELTAAARYIELDNFQLEQIPELLNKSLFISNNDNCVKQSDRLYELIDNETGTITVQSGIVDPVLGQTLRYTAINPSYGLDELYNATHRNGTTYCVCCIYIPQNIRNGKAIYKIEYYIYTNATGDGDINNRDNYEWKTVFEKELMQYTEIIYPNENVPYFIYSKQLRYIYIYNVRVSVTPTTIRYDKNIDIIDIDIKYFGLNHQPLIYANRLINYDAVIEPTQTGKIFKSAPWILQYLTQGVNWLRANDNTKLDKRAYNQIYTNCGYVNVPRSSQGALIIELPFAPNSDVNNSMTYIELNVYSHRKGCSKYIIGVYSYSQNSQYDWSVYSYMGYNYFSKISFGRRTDNNNIVVVLGDFTDLHKNEHFSISHIITGFKRDNDDTDGFLLYTDSDSNNYSSLKQSTNNPLIISYNDLTDKPTLFSGNYDDLTNKPNLATVATSGSYNDLTDKPTFSGSYNDLTDKPTLFSGSYNDLTDKPTLFSGSYDDLTDKPTLFSGNYDDLTNKPTLATVATSGSYNDLTDKPALATVATSGSYNDLTDKPTFSGSYNDLTDKPTLFSGSYNDLTDKPTLATVATSGNYDDLTNKPTLATVATSGSYDDLLNKPDLVFSNIGGNVATAQITDGSITNAKLANSSMTLNGINCELGGIKTLPCIISFDGTLYKVRIYQNWLQIYRNGIWANTFYLLSNPPTECRYITDLSDPSWYDESITEYELDNSATTQLLLADSSTNIANWIEAIEANQITFNSSVISSKNFNKGALDNIISNLKGKGYSVFVENDIDTILNSGNDWVISIKIKRFNNLYKAIIECYVAR